MQFALFGILRGVRLYGQEGIGEAGPRGAVAGFDKQSLAIECCCRTRIGRWSGHGFQAAGNEFGRDPFPRFECDFEQSLVPVGVLDDLRRDDALVWLGGLRRRRGGFLYRTILGQRGGGYQPCGERGQNK